MSYKTPARKRWEALPDAVKLEIAEAVFSTLDDHPEWDSETAQIIGDEFSERGIEWGD